MTDTAPAVRGTYSPSLSYGVRAPPGGSASRTTTTPCREVPTQASVRPRASNAALMPVRAAWTTGRPDSAARRAASDACCAGAQLFWKVEVADWYTISCAPLSAATLDMSGNADSKQMSTPMGSGRPTGPVTVSRCSPVPGILFELAARLILVSQPSC